MRDKATAIFGIITALIIAFCGFGIGFIVGDNRPTTVKDEKVDFNIHTAHIYVDSRGRFIVKAEKVAEVDVKDRTK